jgi:formyl-CoA transferase
MSESAPLEPAAPGLPLAGIKVVEASSFTFAPAAARILAELGADVIKIEPLDGDKARALSRRIDVGDVPNVTIEIANRGKRSLALDLKSDEGVALLHRLVSRSDVFVTNFLPSARRRLRVDVDDLMKVNDRLVYALATGWGRRGPLVEQPGFDIIAAFAASGLADAMTPPGGEPPRWSAPGALDLLGSMTLAGAVSIGLLRAKTAGQGGVVDVSLLGIGTWALGTPLSWLRYVGPPSSPEVVAGNPLIAWYRTSDGRWLYFAVAVFDEIWEDVCRRIDRADLVRDPRFATAESRAENYEWCRAVLREAFSARPLSEWLERFESFPKPWTWAKNLEEVFDDPTVRANGYIHSSTTGAGAQIDLASPPFQLDGVPVARDIPAPEVGAHTDEILDELGFDAAQIALMRKRDVIA